MYFPYLLSPLLFPLLLSPLYIIYQIKIYNNLPRNYTFKGLVIVVVVVPIIEELLFRGLLRYIFPSYGWIIAVIFGLSHMFNGHEFGIYQSFFTIVLGLVLNEFPIITCIFIHMCYNAFPPLIIWNILDKIYLYRG